jgi:TMEM175 potassium channel family protein
MAEDLRGRYQRVFGRGEGTDRIQFFSDAVFAIAMTLLVLEIRLPENADDDLTGALLDLWPFYLAYVLSFVITALNWVTHHRKFRYITRFDGPLIRINLLLLLIVAFVPFPTSVMAEHGDQTAAIVLYAGTVASLSLVQLWIWVHAYRAGLMEKDVDRELYLYVVMSLIPAPLVFLVSIPLAIAWPDWTPFFWILIWPVGVIVSAIFTPRISRSAARRSPDSAS